MRCDSIQFLVFSLSCHNNIDPLHILRATPQAFTSTVHTHLNHVNVSLIPRAQVSRDILDVTANSCSHIYSSAWFAFLLPCYGTFKALSHRPLSEPDLQRWSMYWAVIGAFVAFEYLAEWLISWQVSLTSCNRYILTMITRMLQVTFLLGVQNSVLALPVTPANAGQTWPLGDVNLYTA